MDVYEIYDIMFDVALKLHTTWTPYRYATPLIKPPQISPDALFKSQRNFFSRILRLRGERISGHQREKGRP